MATSADTCYVQYDANKPAQYLGIQREKKGHPKIVRQLVTFSI